MVLEVVSSEGHVIPSYFFQQGFQLNAAVFTEVLETIMKPWINLVYNGCLYMFQQDSAPTHKTVVAQD